jgi:hypothetical protein
MTQTNVESEVIVITSVSLALTAEIEPELMQSQGNSNYPCLSSINSIY